MPSPVRHTDRQTFLARADQAREDAESATLENVRDRCLRAEAAWRMMAARAERSEQLRAEERARKAELMFPAEADEIQGR